MKTKISTRELVITALLIAFGILIPSVFTGPPFRIILPPGFTATLLSHVPIFIAMFISPWAVIFTAIGTTIGFFFTAAPVVAARAGSHIIFAIVGAFMVKKNMNLVSIGVVTAVLHALFEALTVYLFLAIGLTAPQEGVSVLEASFYTTGIGTLIHSTIDFVVAVIVGTALSKAKAIPKLPKVF